MSKTQEFLSKECIFVGFVYNVFSFCFPSTQQHPTQFSKALKLLSRAWKILEDDEVCVCDILEP